MHSSFSAFKKSRLHWDGRTDGRTDGLTDTTSYRDARTHLKEHLNQQFFSTMTGSRCNLRNWYVGAFFALCRNIYFFFNFYQYFFLAKKVQGNLISIISIFFTHFSMIFIDLDAHKSGSMSVLNRKSWCFCHLTPFCARFRKRKKIL